MSLNTYSAAILAAVIMGTAPLFGRLGRAQAEPLVALGIRAFAASGLLLVYLLLTGQAAQLLTVPPRAAGFLALEGLFAALLGHLLYFYALRGGELSKVVPIVNSAPLVAALWGFFFLGEPLNLFKVLGILLVIAGILLIRLA